MTESLILVLTPYETQVICDILEFDLSIDGKASTRSIKERLAIVRVKEKVQYVLTERDRQLKQRS